MLPARALAVLRGCPRGAASRGGLPRRLRASPAACAAAPPSSAGEPGAAARLAASDAAAAALGAAQSPPADAPLRTGRRNMRDAVDSRHACPCCSNDIRGRTVRRVLRHVIAPDRVYTRRKGSLHASSCNPMTPAAVQRSRGLPAPCRDHLGKCAPDVVAFILAQGAFGCRCGLEAGGGSRPFGSQGRGRRTRSLRWRLPPRERSPRLRR